MPSFTFLVENTSPILRYSASPEWTPGESETDNEADQYTESSFTKTNLAGATMSLTFNGTGVTIVGAKRDNHGLFSVTLDGSESSPINGFASPNLFNQTLFENGLLDLGRLHSLVLTNNAAAFVDVDYVAFQVSIGNNTEDLIVNTFQSMHPIFSYTPSSSWKTPSYASSFSGGSGYATQDIGAAVNIAFQGDGIAVYGPVGPNMTTAYNVLIDNVLSSSGALSANEQFYRAQQIIYFATNLGPGPHLLSIELAGTGDLAIDYANVFTTTSLGGSILVPNTSVSSQIPSQIPSHSSKIPASMIFALAFTSALSLCGLCAMGYLVWLKLFKPSNKKRPQNLDRDVVQPFNIDPNLPSTPTVRDNFQSLVDSPTIPSPVSNHPTRDFAAQLKPYHSSTTTPHLTSPSISNSNTSASRSSWHPRTRHSGAPPEYDDFV